MADIGEWLTQLGLGQYIEAFEAEEVDFGAFHNFETEADVGNILETHLRKLVQKKLKSEE